MEISGNKYLHKKFKKQTSCSPVYSAEDNRLGNNELAPVVNNSSTSANNSLLTNSKRAPAIGYVPNYKSTNSDVRTVVNVATIVDNQSSISNVDVSAKEPAEWYLDRCHRHSPEFGPRSISATTTTTDYTVRNFSFDTKPNQTEPNTNNNTTTTAKSSILETVYSKSNQISHHNNNAIGDSEPIERKSNTEPSASGGKYVCTYCNLACSKPSVLQKHIRAHTNERPYPCVSCGFSFKTRSNLYKHCRSRTHANRLMGRHAQSESMDVDSLSEKNEEDEKMVVDDQQACEQKSKPYKPRFHTAKLFFEETKMKELKENDALLDNMSSKYKGTEPQVQANSDLLKLRINELINKNNSIVNCNDAFVIRQKTIENFLENSAAQMDEPLNLTSNNRKRCLSESDNPHKSLIKELLLKNLSTDPNLQCPYCKMIFQTVTELEMHKLKYCNAKTSNIRYARSSSVNVASILTQNKNAFDNIPHMQHTTFPLKSPGPLLGKTRLIDNDRPEKYRTFSFDDNIIMNQSHSDPKYGLHSPIDYLQVKRNSVKLFGGEVKITQTSGETRCFKIESKSIDKIAEEQHQQSFMDFSGSMSENLVIKSSLQSGGTVLQNKSTYSPKVDSMPPSNVIRVYDNSGMVSPNLSPNDKAKMAPSEPKRLRDHKIEENNEKEKDLYKSNLIDFGQKAVKLLAPNLKPPNLAIPGLPIPSAPTSFTPLEVITSLPSIDREIQLQENLNFAKRQISLQQRMAEVSQPQLVYNPMNLVVNGKVIRYVPGMPGPIVDGSEIVSPTKVSPKYGKEVLKSSSPPAIVVDQYRSTRSTDSLEKQRDEPRKFVRPNSLSLKPMTASFKSHHGLTPTIFNQALISPDTPRVAKKYCQQYLNGNYFSYLGLKSSTKSVYCTLNKTQPFYVKHFKKLSMYSEWRQQESKIDSLNVSAYDSRQRQRKYTMAGRAKADLVAHSSYKFVRPDNTSTKDETSSKSNSVFGGYESNEDYTYIRGRGRGRYVCDQCGIRCKKPSMLKKHIRTHSDDRPYTCQHCNFSGSPPVDSFKTKGNLTKHMKSKAHSKKYAATSSMSAQNSVTTSSDSEDSDADSSDESTRLQEHEAAHCLLSLAQKTTPASAVSHEVALSNPTVPALNLTEFPNFLKDDKFLKNPDQINQVTNTNFAKNKILDETPVSFNASKHLNEVFETCKTPINLDCGNMTSRYLGQSALVRPLTYPYLRTNSDVEREKEEMYATSAKEREKVIVSRESVINEKFVERKRAEEISVIRQNDMIEGTLPANIVYRKRKLSSPIDMQYKTVPTTTKPVDLSIPNTSPSPVTTQSDPATRRSGYDHIAEPLVVYNSVAKQRHNSFSESNSSETFSQNSDTYERIVYFESDKNDDVSKSKMATEYEQEQDQSAMETLAEIAIKQVKLEKNMLAKNVASEYLKLALNCDGNNVEGGLKKFVGSKKEAINELIIKSEENKNCSICSKNFSKPSQLRLHMNIHYLERPFRCESCSVSFRTKGHLQKHERSASHHNKLSTSPALSSSEPRPFKCTDCNIAFRIHGHLAKHLRSKMHIMKLECLAKIPFGLYAELERANSLLTEINTTDGDLCLESLKILARKLFGNDPNKLDKLGNPSDNRDS